MVANILEPSPLWLGEHLAGQKMQETSITQAMHPIRILGSIKTKRGNAFNIYATASREHVLMFPLGTSGSQGEQGTPVKIADLSPKIRQKLGC